MSVTKRSDKFEDVAHAGFFVSIEDSSEVPQVWRLRSEGSWTSHNGSSVNFLGDGTIFWGDGNGTGRFSEAKRPGSEPCNKGETSVVPRPSTSPEPQHEGVARASKRVMCDSAPYLGKGCARGCALDIPA